MVKKIAKNLLEDLRTLTICRVMQEEMSVFLEVIVSVIVGQKSSYEIASDLGLLPR
jgi:hypothetical protein